jgi:hypothetical protein
MNSPEAVKPVITYDTSPEQYKHWSSPATAPSPR